MIEDDNMLSEEDIKKLYSGINFGEEILQDDQPTAITSPTFLDEDIPLDNIRLGDELNLDNILQSIDNNVQVNTPNFELDLDELFNQPCDLSSQEVKEHMNNFLESDIAKEIEKVMKKS